eukprot:9631291-Heterocapsa_arctica.AAC.1
MTTAQVGFQKRIFDALNRGNKQEFSDPRFDMDDMSKAEWTPWQCVLDWLQNKKVWGDITDNDFWNVIMQTKHNSKFYHSYMVKYWQDTKCA